MKEMSVLDVKSCALGILRYIDDLCRANNICYYLCGGTLLGAARHKGYIPWDDDIDIMLPRKEYERLIACFPTSGRYRLLTSDNTIDFPYAYGKVVDMATIKIENIPCRYQKTGVDVDVFPIDNFPDDVGASLITCNKIESISRKISHLSSKYSKASTLPRTIAHNLMVPIWHLLRNTGLITMSKYIKQIQTLSIKYNDIDTKFCGIICIAHYGIKERNEKSIFNSTTELEFEGQMYPVPQGYKTYLTRLYGADVMKIPPVEMQTSHHNFKAYWK